MFNVNPGEILVIALIFLLVFGPDRLPEIAVQAGKLYRELKTAVDQASGELTREIEAAARESAEEEIRQKARQRRAAREAQERASGVGGTEPMSDAETSAGSAPADTEPTESRSIAPPNAIGEAGSEPPDAAPAEAVGEAGSEPPKAEPPDAAPAEPPADGGPTSPTP